MNKQFWKINSHLSVKEWVPIASIVIVLAISFLDLIGWIFDMPLLQQIYPQWTPMRVITALCLILYSVALLLIRKSTVGQIGIVFARFTGTFVLVISVLTLTVFTHLLISGSESLLADASFLNLFLAHGNRMAFITALIFLILGLILFLLSGGNKKGDDFAHGLLFPAAILSYFVLVSYLLNVDELFEIDQIFVAFNTGFALFLLCIAIFLIRTDSWLMSILTGHNVGSMMARRLLPGLMILPVLLGWLRIQGEHMGFYKSEVGVILIASTYTVCFLLLVWYSARSVNRIDRQRRESVEVQLLLERRFSTTLSSIGDAVIATDIEGKITFINPVAEKLTGWNLEEALQNSVAEVFNIINEGTQKKAENPVEKVLETGMQVTLANHTVLIRKDGTKVFIDDSAAPIKDKDGTISGVVLVFRDISERRKAEQALRQSEQRLKFHFENSPLAVVEWDADFIVTQWSNEAEHIFGWKKEETLGKPINDLNMIYEEDFPIVNNTMERLSGGKEMMVVSSNRNYTKSGNVIDCTWYNSVLTDKDGKMNSVMSLVQEITERKRAEHDLRESEGKFRLLANTIPQLAWIANADGYIFWYNQRWYDYTGTTPGDMEGWGWQNVHDPQILPEVMEKWKISLTEELPFEMVFPLLGKDGKFRPFLTRVLPLCNSEGKLIQWFGSNTDISEIQEAEQALKESEERFSKAFDFSPMGINIFRLGDGVSVEINDAFLTLIGYSREEVIGHSAAELNLFVNPEDRVAWVQALNSSVTVQNLEIRLRQKSGNIADALFSVTKIDINGEAMGLVQAVDNTKRKKAEEALQESEEKYKELVENANSIIVKMDPEGRTIFFNEFAQRFFGYTEEEVVGKELIDLIVPKIESTGRDMNELLNKIYEDPDKYSASINENIKKNGDRVWISWYNKALYDEEGNRLGHIAIGTDITERKKAEEALQESEQKFAVVYKTAPVGISLATLSNGTLYDVNQAWLDMVGYAKKEEVIGMTSLELGLTPEIGQRERILDEFRQYGAIRNVEMALRRKSGEERTVLVNIDTIDINGSKYMLSTNEDITDRKKIEIERSVTVEFLRLINECNEAIDFVHLSTTFFQRQTGCEAIGIRLKEGEDYPYFETQGFSEAFVLSEKYLCARDRKGNIIHDRNSNPVLECLCGNVICGPSNTSNSNITEYGSFWTNCTSEVELNSVKINPHSRIRNFCNREGYESLALIPLKVGNERIGLLQLNDKRKGVFTSEMIGLMERLSGHFAVALSRFKAEQELRQTTRMLSALGKSSQAMMHKDNETRYLQEICRILVEDCGHSMVWIGYAQDDELKSVKPVAYSGFEEGYLEKLNITWADTKRGRGPTGTAIRTGETTMCKNMLTDPAFEPWREEAIKRGYSSSIVLPLKSDDKTFGALTIYSQAPDPFSAEELNLLSSLADDLARGITTIRLKESENRAVALLKESEEKYRLLFNGMLEGFAYHEIILDEKGKPCDYRFLSMNPAFERHTGLKAENVIGKKVSEVIPTLENYWINTYGEVALTGKSIEFEDYNSELNSYFKVSAFSPRKGYFAVIIENITERTLASKELYNTKTYLESLINYANAPIIVWNPKQEIQLFNRAFEKLTGYSSSEVEGKKLDILFPESSAEETKEKIRQVLYENWESIEIPILTKNGEERIVLWNSANIYDSDNKTLISTIAQGNDVTERTEALKELYHTKSYLESLFNYANAPIIVWNPDLEIQLFNRAFRKLTGYSSSEVEGKKLDILFPESSAKETKEKIRQALYENWESIEIPILTKNGEERTILWNSANIYDSDKITVISTIAQGNDITERKKAEQRLNDAKEKLDLALDNGKIGTFERDFKTNKLIWDSRMEKMFGYKEGTFEGTYEAFEKCLVEEDIPHTRAASRKAVEENIPFETVYRIKLPNGDINHINAKGVVIRDEAGNPLKMEGVCFDVTDMRKGAEKTLIKLNEELQRSNKELEQFAYVASHDLQEPLRMVSSFTQLLQKRYKDKLDEDAQQFIRYAVDGAVRMQNLINDLLNFSRIGTRGQKFVAVDFNHVIGRTISNLTVSIKEKNALVVSDELPAVVGDENQLVQLMQNLIGNAIKFCKTSPRIHISAVEENNHYLFSVKDNGIGIEKNYFEKIFLIFQRLVPKEEYGGTGIGLAICKRIVERHGGKIWVESELDEGSTFYFTINKSKNQ